MGLDRTGQQGVALDVAALRGFYGLEHAHLPSGIHICYLTDKAGLVHMVHIPSGRVVAPHHGKRDHRVVIVLRAQLLAIASGLCDVAAPGHHRAVVQQGQHISVTGRQGHHVAEITVVGKVGLGLTCRACARQNADRGIAVGGSCKTQLPVGIRAPSIHITVLVHCPGKITALSTNVISAGRNGLYAAEVTLFGIRAGLLTLEYPHRKSVVGGIAGADAQLAYVVVPPSPDIAVLIHGHRKGVSRGNGNDAGQRRTIHVGDHLNGHSAVGRRAVAQLAIGVLTPSPDRAVGAQRDSEGRAPHDLGRSHPVAGLHAAAQRRRGSSVGHDSEGNDTILRRTVVSGGLGRVDLAGPLH